MFKRYFLLTRPRMRYFITLLLIGLLSLCFTLGYAEEDTDPQELEPIGTVTFNFSVSGSAVSEEGVRVVANINASKTIVQNEKGGTISESANGNAKMITSDGTVSIVYQQNQKNQLDNPVKLEVFNNPKKAEFLIPMGSQAVAVDIPVKSSVTVTGGGNSITEHLEGVISGSIPGYSYGGQSIRKSVIISSWDGKTASGSFTKPVKVLVGPSSVLWFLDDESAHMTNVPLITGTVFFKWSLASQGLKADFNYSSVERGEITLDASNSTGKIQKYLWSFEPIGQTMPEGVRFDNSVQLEGKSVKVVLLAPVKVKLTVIDDQGNKDEQELEIPIKPREWKTSCTHDRQNIGAFQANEPVATNGDMPLTINWGRNVCALCDNVREEGAIYHPSANGNTFDPSGYNLSEVSTGPFTGTFYVKEYKIKIKRKPLLNVNFFPGAPFYDRNLENKTDIAQFRESTLDHESFHTQLLQEALHEFDPAKDLEALFAGERNELRDKADSILFQRETDLSNKFCDEAEVRKRLREKYGVLQGKLMFKNEGIGGDFVYKKLYYYNKLQSVN